MPEPAQFYFDSRALVAAHQAILDLIDFGSESGEFRLYDENDVYLGKISLAGGASGSVDPNTGVLTLNSVTAGTFVADGVVSYGLLTDSDQRAIATLPATDGPADSGLLALNTLTAITGGEVSLLFATIGG